jgi:DHA1 family bicyclomycin/chloramphenicol resistance-like MFS transporter
MTPKPRDIHPALFIAVIAGVVAYGAAAMDVYVPSMPSMASALATDATHVQLTMSLFVIGYAASQLIYGPISDRFGRRRVLIAGTVIFVAASLAGALATSIETLIACRVVQAFGACAGPVVGRAIVRDRYGREGAARIFSYIGMAMVTTPILAPIIGGWLEVGFGWRANFYFMTGFGVVGLVAILVVLDETLAAPNLDALRPKRLVRNYASLLVDPAFMGYALTIACAFGGVMAFITGSSFVLIDLAGVDPPTYGLLFGLTAGGFVVGSFASARRTRRWGIARCVRYGATLNVLAAAALAGLSLAGVFGVWAIIAPMVAISIANGLIFPNCQAGAVGPFPHMAATAAALVGSMMMTASFIVSVVIAAAYDETGRPMTLAILACGVLQWAIFHVLVWRTRGSAPEPLEASMRR